MELIEKLTHLGVAAKNAKNKFFRADGSQHVREEVLSASELGSCIRKTKYKKVKAPTNKRPQKWGAAERGNSGEAWVVEVLRLGLEAEGLGGKLLYAGEEQVSLVEGDIGGTPDGLIVYPDGREYGLEIKTADPMLKLDEAREKHAIQSELQIELWHKCTPHRPTEVHLVYYNAADYSIITEFIIERNPEIWEYAKQRAQVMWDNDPDDLLPEGAFRGDCDWCEFSDLCLSARISRLPDSVNEPLPEDILVELEPLVDERYTMKTALKMLEEDVKRVDEQIKVLMGMADSKRGNVGEYRVSIALVAGRTTYDIDMMREDGIDVEKYSSKGNPHSRLTVNRPK